MASALFNKGRQNILEADIDWLADDIKVVLIKSSYTFDNNDEFIADLGSVLNGESANLGSKTSTDGIADAADTSLVATDAAACDALILFKDTGNTATDLLIAYVDISEFTPSASQTINITWSDGANKIFKL